MGVVLVILGIQTFLTFRRRKIHVHQHQHDGQAHIHFHSHEATSNHLHHREKWANFTRMLIAGIVPGEHSQSEIKNSLKPFFRVKSFVVGTVHGLAGSAALMLLVLASLKSAWLGAWYILVFGLGTLAAMGLLTVFITMPFSASARLPLASRIITGAAGTVSIVFGIYIMYSQGLAAYTG